MLAAGDRHGGLHPQLPPMSAVGARQHPQQGPLLSGSGSWAGGTGGVGGETGGGPTRPATGLLWPRGI